MGLRPSVILALSIAMPGVACGDGETGGSAAEPGPQAASSAPAGSERPADVIRVWRRVGAAEITAEADPQRPRLPAAEARSATWYRLVPAGLDHVDLVSLVPGTAGVELLSGRDVGVALPIPARMGEALGVRVRLRVPDTLPAATVLAGSVLHLTRPVDPEAGLSHDHLLALLDPARGSSHTLRATADGGRVTLLGDLVVDEPVAGLLLLLLAPDPGPADGAPVVVETAEVFQRTVPGHFAAGHRPAGIVPTDDGPDVRAMLDRDRRAGLVALPGARYRVELPPDVRPRRLELGLGVAGRPAGFDGALRVRVLADGEALLDERLESPWPQPLGAWRERSLALPAGCRELVLESMGEGPDPPLVVWGQPTVRARTARRRPHVVLISLDTLRPDHLGCHGAEPSPSPRLDALAAEGLLFTNAYAPSSYTLPSHASMLSGQHPSRHGLVDRPGRLQRGRSPALAEILAEAGWVTTAFTGGGFVGSAFGLDRGFDRFTHNDPVWALGTVRGEQLIEVDGVPSDHQRALLERHAAPMIAEWIARQDDGVPFFLFLHTYIVHNYAPDRRRIEQHRLLDPFGEERPLVKDDWNRFNNGERFLRRSVHDQYVPFYDATIAMADEFVGGVLDAIEAAGLAEDTLVIVTSDHGEEFGEHGYFGHGQTLFDSNARVPLIVRLPADPEGRLPPQPAAHDGLISLVDLAPWILRIVGLPVDPRMAVEPPLGPEQAMPPARSRVFLDLDTSYHRVRAVRQGAHKLHARSQGETFLDGTGLVRLYDVDADPDELHDLGSTTQEARDLLSLLDEFTRHAETLGAEAADEDEEVAPLDDDVLESLRQLGYLDGEATGTEADADVGAAPGDPDGLR